jgi:hypothetical protein
MGRGRVVGIATRYRLDGDRIPVKARFSAHVRTGPGTFQPTVKLVPGLFPAGKAAGAWR